METSVSSNGKCVTCKNLLVQTSANQNDEITSCINCKDYYHTILQLLENQDEKMFHALIVDCTTCNTPMIYKKIFMCMTGHLVCESCNNMALCPFCITQMTKGRNIPAEHLSRLSMEYILSAPTPVYCMYQNDGCDVRSSIGDIEEHELTCPFLTTVCFHCGTQVYFKELYKHWMEKHLSQISYNGIMILTEDFKPYIYAFNESFILNNFSSKKGNMFTVTHLTLKGENKENVTYNYVLEFLNSKSGKSIKLKGKCMTIEVNARKKNVEVESIHTACISFPELKSFVTSNGYFSYKPLILKQYT